MISKSSSSSEVKEAKLPSGVVVIFVVEEGRGRGGVGRRRRSWGGEGVGKKKKLGLEKVGELKMKFNGPQRFQKPLFLDVGFLLD